MIDNNTKEWIDGASYLDLLTRRRFSPSGDIIFQGKIGNYYKKAMDKRKKIIGQEECANISKLVGWSH